MELTKLIDGVPVKIEITEEDMRNLRLQKAINATPNLVLFELSMPKNNAWNGIWSGKDDIHVIIKKKSEVKNIDEILKTKDFFYDFGDGWEAKINVRLINNYEAKPIRKNNKGFCGYDWMVKNIITQGKIK